MILTNAAEEKNGAMARKSKSNITSAGPTNKSGVNKGLKRYPNDMHSLVIIMSCKHDH